MKTILASLAVLTACSSSPLDPGAGNGTSMLSVDLDVIAALDPAF